MLLGLKHDRDWERSVIDEDVADPGLIPVMRRFRVPVGKASLVGRRLVFLSDLHWRRTDEFGAEPLIESVNAAEPDWIVFGGDLIRHLEHLPASVSLLGHLRARRGKLAVIGNRERHHFWMPLDAWRQHYDQAGFRLLVNEAWTSPEPTDTLFVGLDDCKHGKPDLDCAAELAGTDRFVVLVSHSPDAVGNTAGRFIGHLVLAGHTHGGQLRVPGIGPVYTASAYWRQFDLGWYRRRSDGARMYITAGLGETGRGILRCRLCCPAEIVAFDFVERA